MNLPSGTRQYLSIQPIAPLLSRVHCMAYLLSRISSKTIRHIIIEHGSTIPRPMTSVSKMCIAVILSSSLAPQSCPSRCLGNRVADFANILTVNRLKGIDPLPD
jgi:hypothetical protein